VADSSFSDRSNVREHKRILAAQCRITKQGEEHPAVRAQCRGIFVRALVAGIPGRRLP
jgi:hypothetical protein